MNEKKNISFVGNNCCGFSLGSLPDKLAGSGQGSWSRRPGRIFESHYPNGRLKQEGILVDDKPEGELRIYYQNGRLQEKRIFRDGKKNGPFKFYYESGQLQEKGNFINGKKEGAFQDI
ncbi:MAG: hypothetical protein COV73_00030 [Candidatus Omnitrophica bacterium CG11_big_fil_rev_8_21_14_0_20_43_6]|nr:MAG: hypothetical protein COV73_00030 [Candidatus Omnitrophica bacterium CG11_big_fil_rev_8_21_14_0_20_43_6]